LHSKLSFDDEPRVRRKLDTSFELELEENGDAPLGEAEGYYLVLQRANIVEYSHNPQAQACGSRRIGFLSYSVIREMNTWLIVYEIDLSRP
jgi:hypothetical protein